MPRKPVVTLPTDFFEAGNIRALCMKKGGEEALVVYLQLYCMAVKQDRDGKLMLYDNIPLDDTTIARLMYKTERAYGMRFCVPWRAHRSPARHEGFQRGAAPWRTTLL